MYGNEPKLVVRHVAEQMKVRPCDNSCVKVVPLNVQHTHWLNSAPEEFTSHFPVFESSSFAIRVHSMDNEDSLCRKIGPGNDSKNAEISSEILGCVIGCLVPDISREIIVPSSSWSST